MLKKLSKKGISLIIAFTLFVTMLSPLVGNVETAKAASSYPYYIKVNKTTNVVTVYAKDSNGRYTKPVKAFVCSVGYETPVGTFRTPAKYRWRALIGPSYGQYSTRIVGSILFHSVWYYKTTNDSLSISSYNKLGTTCSHGCIRLTVADAKWIYDNCALGTTVNIFNGSSKDDPLGKPKAIKLHKEGWDPTDPDPRNPYKNAKPTITGAKDKIIEINTSINLKAGVYAKDSTGNDATSLIKVESNLNTKKAGKYKVTYSVTDAIHRTTKKTITVTVKDTTRPIISGVKNRTVEYASKPLDLKNGVTAKTPGGKDLTSKIQVTGKVDYHKLGKYNITYSVTGSNGVKAAKTAVITVVDTKKPIISGAKSYTIERSSKAIDLAKGVTAKMVSGKNLTSKIQIGGSINPNKVGEYQITYSVTGTNNKTTKKVITITVVDSTPPEIGGVKDRTITYRNKSMTADQKIALLNQSALEGITLTEFGKKLDTDLLDVTIETINENQFKVTYTYITAEDKEISKSATVTLVYEEPDTSTQITE